MFLSVRVSKLNRCFISAIRFQNVGTGRCVTYHRARCATAYSLLFWLVAHTTTVPFAVRKHCVHGALLVTVAPVDVPLLRQGNHWGNACPCRNAQIHLYICTYSFWRITCSARSITVTVFSKQPASVEVSKTPYYKQILMLAKCFKYFV